MLRIRSKNRLSHHMESSFHRFDLKYLINSWKMPISKLITMNMKYKKKRVNNMKELLLNSTKFI
jgi:hypothetical protein